MFGAMVSYVYVIVGQMRGVNKNWSQKLCGQQGGVWDCGWIAVKRNTGP